MGRLVQILVPLTFALLSVVVAFTWGYYLMGAEGGGLFAIQAACVALFIVWCLVLAKRPSWWRDVAVAAMSLRIIFGIVFPTLVGPDYQGMIDRHTEDLALRGELVALLSADPAYHKLSFSTQRLKVVNVTVSGDIESRSDLDRLRNRVNAECPTLRKGFVHWDIWVRQSRERLHGLDDELFDPVTGQRRGSRS